MCPIPTELEDFVVDDGMCDCWGDADYEPTEELKILMSQCEREHLQDEESELEDFEIPTPRKAKSFQQRLAEKKTREKRLAMAKEARRWHMNQELSEMQVPTAWSPSTSTLRKKKMAPLPKISPLRLNSATALRQKPEAIQTTRRGVFLQYGSDRSEDPSLSSNRFKTPTKSKDADTMSVRSVMSTATRQRMLYALEWDSK